MIWQKKHSVVICLSFSVICGNLVVSHEECMEIKGCGFNQTGKKKRHDYSFLKVSALKGLISF